MTIRSAKVLQRVCIYNMLGVKVKELTLNDREVVLDLSGLPSGVYAVEMIGENNRLSRQKSLLYIN